MIKILTRERELLRQEMVKLNYDQDTNKGERAVKVGDG